MRGPLTGASLLFSIWTSNCVTVPSMGRTESLPNPFDAPSHAPILRAGVFLPSLGGQMTESMIEATEAKTEEFTDELSDEALDRTEEAKHCGGMTFPNTR